MEKEKKELEASFSSLVADFDALQMEKEKLLQERANPPDHLEKAHAYDTLLVENKRLMDELQSLRKIQDGEKMSSIERAISE